MHSVRTVLLSVCFLGLIGLVTAQDPKGEKTDPKAKEAPARAKGILPSGWREIGLTDDQRQKVYTIDAKYDEEIDKLTLKIKELKEKKRKEQLDVLTMEQKKRLEDNFKKKAGIDKP